MVSIGNRVRFGPYCVISDTELPLPLDVPRDWDARGIMIGDDVWIGARVTVMPGVRIGDPRCHRGRGASSWPTSTTMRLPREARRRRCVSFTWEGHAIARRRAVSSDARSMVTEMVRERLANLRRAMNDLASRFHFRSFDMIGRQLSAFGAPSISNEGRMELGDAVSVSSIPVRSHFAASTGSMIRIGDGVRIAHGVGIFTSSEVIIGAHTTIGALVLILDVELHGESGPHRRSSPRIHIGRKVHLGSGVVVLRGASIADGAHVKPNSVVDGYLS